MPSKQITLGKRKHVKPCLLGGINPVMGTFSAVIKFILEGKQGYIVIYIELFNFEMRALEIGLL